MSIVHDFIKSISPYQSSDVNTIMNNDDLPVHQCTLPDILCMLLLTNCKKVENKVLYN